MRIFTSCRKHVTLSGFKPDKLEKRIVCNLIQTSFFLLPACFGRAFCFSFKRQKSGVICVSFNCNMIVK